MEPKISQKAWNPELEKEILEEWELDGIYDFTPNNDTNNKNYTIDTPPPYPSGRPWHIGAAAHYSQIDMIARTARMAGKNVYFPIGIDRNGLPVELYTEKKHKIRMRETDRAEFLDLCREALDDLESEMILIMRGLGLSGDIAHHYRTDSKEYRALTQSTFIKLWRSGLVYLANRPNNYDWASGTTIADAEIVYEDLPTKLVYMRFGFIGVDLDDGIVVATTRPELLCACKAVLVNPEDSRHAKHAGRRLAVPITNAEVDLMMHHSAKQEFGSGAVMICSYGDHNDVAMFRELGLQEVVAIGLDGRMTEAAGKYAGLRPKQARAQIIEDLQAAGLVEKIEEITHRTPVSERSKTPIEIIPMEEYYLKQKESVQRVRQLGDEITFHPNMHHQILNNWLDSINIDWPISRRRYYGTEIPVWYCKRCSEPYVPEPGRYYRPWQEECPAEKCTKCGMTEFAGEERTFDTWMDSSISPLFVSRFGRDDDFFKSTYPASIRPQAKDIVRTWLYYTLLRCDQLTGTTPWSEAWIMGYGLDERGTKMSKSKGNAIDPLPLIEELGADTFRFWSASEVNHGHDFRCSLQKIQSSKKFLSKLWNVSRFLSNFPVPEGSCAGDAAAALPDQHPHNLLASDRWILSELDRLIKECAKGYGSYNFFVPAIAIREFVWNLFAAHYIEMVKARAYGPAGSSHISFSKEDTTSAIYTLHKVLSTALLLLAPITPFITEYLWKKMYSKQSIHLQRRAGSSDDDDDAPNTDPPTGVHLQTDITKTITEFNSHVWSQKREQGLSLKDPIHITVPVDLKPFKVDLVSMHNLKC